MGSLADRIFHRCNHWLMQACVQACVLAGLLAATPVWAAGDVLTQHNDASRSGAQLQETVLTPANVTPNTFGRLYERTVNGQIISQPLYVSGLSVPNLGVRNVVYVVTRANVVYAFDADSADTDPTHGQIWSAPVTVEAAAPVPGMCGETQGPVGVTSTPVIDRTTNTMYLVARRSDGTIWLNALNIATGAPAGAGAVQIVASANGMSFNQSLELQRAGILLQNGALVLAFSALNCDNAGWHGWVLAYRTADLAQVGAFATTSAAGFGGGVWQSGTGLVGDGSNVYFMTGNGSVSGATDLGESFVKLTLGSAPGYGLTYNASYAVANWPTLNAGDTDLGSGGPLLLPGNRVVGGGKQGKLYVLNSANMLPSQNPPTPGAQPSGGSDGFQAFVNTWHDNANSPACMSAPITGIACYMPHGYYELTETFGPNIHTGLIYWNGRVYGMPEKDYLRAFAYDPGAGVLATTPAAVGSVRSPDGMPGSALSLSANGASNGIIWASTPKFDGQWANVPGSLIAFDAQSLNVLWRDDDDVAFAKFNPPTIGGGKVFRPTFANKLIVYGPTTGPTAQICYTIPQLYQNYTGAQGQLGNADGAAATQPDGVGSAQTFSGNTAAIYWSPTTCAHEMHGAIYSEYKALSSSVVKLGYPVTSQSPAGDGIGSYNDFPDGSIYWSPLTGAHEINGPIRAYWLSQGGIASALGYPISDETDQYSGGGRFNIFEHGVIYWKRSTSAITVSVNAGVLIGPQEAFRRVGLDFSSFALPEANPAICQERCASNGQCVAWSYVAPNTTQGPNPMCWLKGSIPPVSAGTCCTSGIKVAIQPATMSAMQGAHDEPGGDFFNYTPATPDPRLCQGECAGNSTCEAWSYQKAPARVGLRPPNRR